MTGTLHPHGDVVGVVPALDLPPPRGKEIPQSSCGRLTKLFRPGDLHVQVLVSDLTVFAHRSLLIFDVAASAWRRAGVRPRGAPWPRPAQVHPARFGRAGALGVVQTQATRLRDHDRARVGGRSGCGAGTIGGWASCLAAMDDAERVVVLERGVAGQGASSRAAGIVRAQRGTPAGCRSAASSLSARR